MFIHNRTHEFLKKSVVAVIDRLSVHILLFGILNDRGHPMTLLGIFWLPGSCHIPGLLMFPSLPKPGRCDLVGSHCSPQPVPGHFHGPYIDGIGHRIFYICHSGVGIYQSVPVSIPVNVIHQSILWQMKKFIPRIIGHLCKISSGKFQIRHAAFKGKYRNFPVCGSAVDPVLLHLPQFHQVVIYVVAISHNHAVHRSLDKYVQVPKIIVQNIRVLAFHHCRIPDSIHNIQVVFHNIPLFFHRLSRIIHRFFRFFHIYPLVIHRFFRDFHGVFHSFHDLGRIFHKPFLVFHRFFPLFHNSFPAFHNIPGFRLLCLVSYIRLHVKKLRSAPGIPFPDIHPCHIPG